MIDFIITGQQLTLCGHGFLASDQADFAKLRFAFSADWDGLDKTAQFTQREKTYNVHLGTGSPLLCYLPAEIMAGVVGVSVFGYASDGATIATTAPLLLSVKKSGFVGDGETAIPPTPDLYAQLLEKIVTATVAASVEQTDTGATITITDKDGTTTAEITNGKDGADGENGQDGADGASAYEIAVQNGFTGTEAEWLASLKGEKGDTGESGADGKDGQDGADGISPAATVTQTDTGATITITDKDGTTTAEITNGKDGKDGQDGADGTSPTATVTQTDTGATITITDKDGTTTANIFNGKDGTGGNGTTITTGTFVLSALDWEDDCIKIELDGITSKSCVDLALSYAITAEQLEAFLLRTILPIEQGDGYFVLKAFNGAPTIDIPMRYENRGESV